ncbi:YCR087C-A [Zygosaccharomyces parabailii]|nr:YCR087C-A [Zygosaccharomyces parabailii]CDH09127.1 uncharacterized protein ZBAI_00911 [Zygosaccharomyces bailii ISA1307]
MVTFNCEVCNATVPKKNSEKHYYKCPDAYYTCIDCSKTFEDGVSYKQHTQCLTEDEKYQGALYKGPKSGKQTGKKSGKTEKKNVSDHSSNDQNNSDSKKTATASAKKNTSEKESKKNTSKADRKSKSDKTDAIKHTKFKVTKKSDKGADVLSALRAELRSGETLYNICHSVDKSRKKELLKHLIVKGDGTLVLK